MNSNLEAISVTLESGDILTANKLIKENEEIQANFSDDIISSDIIDKEIEDCNGVNNFIDNLPEAIPCFTPDEMESLGVFDQYADNNYFNAESTKESYEWFLGYKATGNPGIDWYNKLRKVYAEYTADKSNKNKQRVLELGWNPYINPNEENLKKAADISKVKLAENYSCQVIDLTNLNEEGLVDSAEDELKRWGDYLIKVATSLSYETGINVYPKGFLGDGGEWYFAQCYHNTNKDKIPLLIEKLNASLISQNVLDYKVRNDFKEEDGEIYLAVDIVTQTGDLPIVESDDETQDDSEQEELVSIYNGLVSAGKFTGDLEIDYWNAVGVDLFGESYIEEGVSISDRVKDKEYISKPFNVRKLTKDIKFDKKLTDEEKSKQMRMLTYNLVEATTFSVIPFGFVWKFVYESFFILMGKNKKKEIEKLDEKIDLQTDVLQDKIEVEKDSIMLKMYNTNLGALRDLKTYIKASLSSLKKKIVKEASVANKGLKPVFIVTSFTNTQFGHVIAAYTKDTYSHASMALDAKLDKMYTFTRGAGEAGDGFAVESLEGYLRQYQDSIIHVSVVFVKSEDYQTLKQKIDFYINNIQKTTYNSLNCIRLVLGKEIKKHNNELSMICSQFVDNMMKFIGADLTNKPSNLVTPADFHKLNHPKVFKLYEGKVKDYDPKAINKKINYILNKRHSVAIKESRLLSLLTPEPVFEAKEFPVQFDEEGNLLIKKKKELDYLKEYQNSKKLHKSYRKYNNLEGMKYEAAKLWYLNTVILSTIENDTVTPEEGEKLRDARSKILTEFSLYMNDIQKMDNSFNFQSYYNSTPFSDDKIKVKKSTIQHTWELLKSMGKHILL